MQSTRGLVQEEEDGLDESGLKELLGRISRESEAVKMEVDCREISSLHHDGS